ncbi:MAG: RNA methyltransferase [Saprospiraceae bacterium]|nr:RNA methyltransferase [Saprospiraceae bacterium]
MKITSIHNQKILALRKLYKSNERKHSEVFIAEGKKEVERGLMAGFEAVSVYYSSDIIDKISLENIVSKIRNKAEFTDLDKSVYEKIAYRDNTEGIIALFRKKVHVLEDISVGYNDIFVILEAIEKPGNLGAILRSSNAAGVKAIILTETKVDQYHPNVIRSSLGAVFEIPVIITSNSKVLEWLKIHNIKAYSAALPSYASIFQLDLRGNISLVFGAESDGLSDFWIKSSDEIFTIPMKGIIDSLNVSVSVAISLYEAVRQGRILSN